MFKIKTGPLWIASEFVRPFVLILYYSQCQTGQSTIINPAMRNASKSPYLEEDALTPQMFSVNKTINEEPCGSEGEKCVQRICTESNISFIKQVVEYNWKIHNLRQYIAHQRIINASKKVYLSKTIPFPNFVTGAANWTFELGSDNEADATIGLRVFCEQIFINDDLSQSTTFQLRVSISNGNYSINSTIQTSRINYVNDYCLIDFLWDLQNSPHFFHEFQNLILAEGSDVIDFNFEITAVKADNVVSSEVDCNKMQYFRRNIQIIAPFIKQLPKLMNSDKYSDLVLKSGDEEFKVHRVILANSSPKFASLISNNSFDKNESLLDLGLEIESDIVEEIIRFVYTGKVEDVGEIADRVIIAAEKFGFPELKYLCEDELMRQLNTDNMLGLYLLSKDAKATRLEEMAFTLMKQNKGKIANQTEEFKILSVHHTEIMHKLFLT